MSANIRLLILYIGFFLLLWFSGNQLNFFGGWVSLYFPMFWLFVFFPAMSVRWEMGMLLTLLVSIFWEAQYPMFRGVLVPVSLALFLFLQYRQARIFEVSYLRLAAMASIIHLAFCISMTLTVLMKTGIEWRYLLLRTLQDWATGQLLLVLGLPVVWWGILAVSGRRREAPLAGLG